MLAKKILIAAGVVCVIAPAALAVMKDSGGAYGVPDRVSAPVEALIRDLQRLISSSDLGEGRTPAHFERTGETKIPFARLARAKAMYPGIAEFLEYGIEDLGNLSSSAAVAETGSPGYAPLGTLEEQQAAELTSGVGGGSSSGAGGSPFPLPSVGSGPAAAGGAGFPGGAGGSAPGETTAELLLEEQVVDDATLLSMPVPASLWMLIGAMAGLCALGYRRGVASS